MFKYRDPMDPSLEMRFFELSRQQAKASGKPLQAQILGLWISLRCWFHGHPEVREITYWDHVGCPCGWRDADGDHPERY